MDNHEEVPQYWPGLEDWRYPLPYDNEPTPYGDPSHALPGGYYDPAPYGDPSHHPRDVYYHGESAYADPPQDYHPNYSGLNVDVPSQVHSTDVAKGIPTGMDSVDDRLASKEKATDSQQGQYKCQHCGNYTGKTPHTLKEHIKFTHIGEYCMWNGCGFKGTESEVREHLRSTHARKILVSDATNGVAKPPRYMCNWEFEGGSKCKKTFARYDGVVRDFFHHNRELCLP
ncbi:uncharacterized protein F4812DRAFT_464328 [Daldinia caldariorum]|uniref:uncharacterized protein n=1 Tax=Daldinia caldariorum TaxID=326644 RepID=UPI002007AAC2|nr:uncharacterized protein F4812DRAFT_464328 [Daldinia caldariorum]KAI1472160.1 hypothetical protein F4812DRAFT_464328 [Daldinia caldariorum]